MRWAKWRLLRIDHQALCYTSCSCAGNFSKNDVTICIPGLQLEHQVQDPDANRDVEHADRLVGEHDLRLDRERARDGDPLSLAARELILVLGGDVLGRHEADGAQELVDALFDLGAANDAVDP